MYSIPETYFTLQGAFGNGILNGSRPFISFEVVYTQCFGTKPHFLALTLSSYDTRVDYLYIHLWTEKSWICKGEIKVRLWSTSL